MNPDLKVFVEDNDVTVELNGNRVAVQHGTLVEVVNYHLNRFGHFLDLLAAAGCDDKAEVGKSVLTTARHRIGAEVEKIHQHCGEIFVLERYEADGFVDDALVDVIFVPADNEHFDDLVFDAKEITVINWDF